MKSRIFFLGALVSVFTTYAQIGGRTAFDFMRLNASARVAALGGENVSSSDWDPNMFLANPASIDSAQYKKLSINYLPFNAGITKGDFSYVLPFKKFKGIGLGIQYIDYGDFDQTDGSGNELGEFSAREYALVSSVAHQQNNIALGASVKFLGSHIGGYSAFGLLTDIGALFNHPDKDFQVGLVFKNVGVILKKHAEEQSLQTPVDIQLGWSYKLEHMPLRFSMTAHNIQKWDVQYLDPSRDFTLDDEGEEVARTKSFGQKLFRHFVFGGEFMLMDGFHLRAGYNFIRRQELKIEERRGMTGFSFGGMVRFGWLEFNFSRTLYHISGGTNVISLTMDTSKFMKRREVEIQEI